MDLGADVRWVSCNIFSTQDHAAAAVAVGPDGTVDEPQGCAVFAWKGETLEEYWWCTEQALLWPDGSGPDLIVDDGGDATLLVHKGVEFERAGESRRSTRRHEPEEWGVILELLRRIGRGPRRAGTRVTGGIRGVSEETTTGVHRLYEMEKNGTLLFPAINVNDSVTKSKFDNIYGCRHSVVDGLNRATDVMIGGKVAVVLRLRRGGQGMRPGAARPGRAGGRSPRSTRSARCRRPWRATRSIRLEDVVDKADIFITATGNRDVITAAHMGRMKDKAIVGNIGHFDNEIDMAGLKKLPGMKRINIKPQYDEFGFPDGHSVHGPRRGATTEPRLRHRPPLLRHVRQLHQPGDGAARALAERPPVRRRRCTCCPRSWTKKWPGCTSKSWAPT